MSHHGSFIADNDTWFVSNNALRRMMDDICLATEVICIKARLGKLAVWHLQYLKEYWGVFQQAYDEHQARKQQIILPLFCDKVDLPTILSFQSNQVQLEINDCKIQINSIDFNSNEIVINVQQLSDKVRESRNFLFKCFKDEETQAIETVYKCFSKKDIQDMLKNMKEDLKPSSYGWLLYGFLDDKKRDYWVKNILKSSFYTRMFVINPSVKGFKNTTRRILLELVTTH